MKNNTILDILDVINNLQTFTNALSGIETIAYHSDSQLTAAELFPCLLQIRQNIHKETERLQTLIAELRN